MSNASNASVILMDVRSRMSRHSVRSPATRRSQIAQASSWPVHCSWQRTSTQPPAPSPKRPSPAPGRPWLRTDSLVIRVRGGGLGRYAYGGAAACACRIVCLACERFKREACLNPTARPRKGKFGVERSSQRVAGSQIRGHGMLMQLKFLSRNWLLAACTV